MECGLSIVEHGEWKMWRVEWVECVECRSVSESVCVECGVWSLACVRGAVCRVWDVRSVKNVEVCRKCGVCL